MKIEQISRLVNCGVFHDLSWPTELPNFSKFNLIYGWNGSGKTTLSNCFSHLKDGDPIDGAQVQFLVGGNAVELGAASEIQVPDIRVFNRDTISRSLFEIPNAEFPPIYYLGEQSAATQRNIEELQVRIDVLADSQRLKVEELSKIERDLDKHCVNKAAEIKALLTVSGGGIYNNYNKSDYSKYCDRVLKFNPNPFCLVKSAYQTHLEKKDAIGLEKISRLPTNLPNIYELQQAVSDILEKCVTSDVIDSLRENQPLSDWVQKGLFFHTIPEKKEAEINCQFCENAVSVERITQLNSHFNDEFTNFQRQLDSKFQEIEHWREYFENIALFSENLLYPTLREDYGAAVKSWHTTKGMVLIYLDALVNALREKRDQPFRSIDLLSTLQGFGDTENEKSTIKKFLGILYAVAQGAAASVGLSAIESINGIVDKHNGLCENFRSEAEKSRRVLEMHQIGMSVLEYEESIDRKRTLAGEIESINRDKRLLDQEMTGLLAEFSEIDRPAEELTQEMAAYLGREELKFEVRGNGYVITRGDYPALNLSEGEKTAIAFIYFLKTLEDKDFNIEQSIVVIDDPISSLDFNTMYSAYSFMFDRTKNAGQLFVLTHCFTFFRHVRRWFNSEPKLPAIQGHEGSNDYRTPSRFYMLEAARISGVRTAGLAKLDPLLEKYESEYQFLFKKVYDFVHADDSTELEDFYGLPNIARRLLESFLTFKMPDYHASQLESKLNALDYSRIQKARILRFLHVHSHYDQIGEPEHDLSLLSETRAVMEDLMDLILNVDEDHYRSMTKVLGVSLNER